MAYAVQELTIDANLSFECVDLSYAFSSFHASL